MSVGIVPLLQTNKRMRDSPYGKENWLTGGPQLSKSPVQTESSISLTVIQNQADWEWGGFC